MKAIQLRRSRLLKWLRDQHPEAIVGKRSDCHECVLARFLEAQGARAAYVWQDSFSPDEFNIRFRPLPWWAREFVRDLDHLPGRSSISAGVALRALEAIR